MNLSNEIVVSALIALIGTQCYFIEGGHLESGTISSFTISKNKILANILRQRTLSVSDRGRTTEGYHTAVPTTLIASTAGEAWDNYIDEMSARKEKALEKERTE